MRAKPVAALAAVLLSIGSARGAAERAPNVLLLITDEQQADALSALHANGDLRTPHLDRLANRGFVFTRAYAANPRCTPSRSSLLTGYYPHQVGVEENKPAAKYPFSAPLLGRYFQRHGYRTAYFGTFHIPVDDPGQHGFDELQVR